MRWPRCIWSLLLLQLVVVLLVVIGPAIRAGAISPGEDGHPPHAPELDQQRHMQQAPSPATHTLDRIDADGVLRPRPSYHQRQRLRRQRQHGEQYTAVPRALQDRHVPGTITEPATSTTPSEANGAQQAGGQPVAAAHVVYEARDHQDAAALPRLPKLISVEEQLQQAEAMGTMLTQEQLLQGTPLLGRKAPPPRGPVDWPDGYVAICTIVKNQHEDLREWVEYHKYIGAHKIYVYDNNSTVPLALSIADHLHSGLVEYSYLTGRKRYSKLFRTSPQWTAYNDCVARYRHRHRWLAFIDADEFIVFHNTTKQNLNDFMFDYEQYGGLALNWVIFGSSGHKRRPAGGVLINYTQCLPFENVENNHVKVIANTRWLLTIGDDPHTALYKQRDKYTVNEAGVRVDGAKTKAPSQRLVGLYHYLTKSEEEYQEKMARGSAAGHHKTMDFFNAINALANSTCTHAVQLGLKCCQSVHADLAGLADGPCAGALRQGTAARRHT